MDEINTDEAAEHVQAFVDAWTNAPVTAPATIRSLGGGKWTLTVDHLRTLLAERKYLIQRAIDDGDHSWQLAVERDVALDRVQEFEDRLVRITALEARARQLVADDVVAVPRDAFKKLVRVAGHVSRGRGAAFLRPYPDVTARFALGALHEAGLLDGRDEEEDRDA